MKKVFALVLSFVIVASLTGCSCSTSSSTNDVKSTDKAQDAALIEYDNRWDSKQVLVTYFSPANNNTSDVISSATPMIDGESSVGHLASIIAQTTGASLAPIVTNEVYPTGYSETATKAKSERDNNERCDFTVNANPEEFDVIFVGYPIWWYEMPMVMDTFFEKYNLDGKIIIPFNTHEGSADGGTYDDIRKLEPKAIVIDGFNVRGNDVKDADDELKTWLSNLSV